MIIRSAALDLAYQRSRAPHPLTAARAFAQDQLALLNRIVHLGLRSHLRLAQLELRCAHAGLNYKTGLAFAPPWRLPSAFASLPVSELPAHPLIDPQFLAEVTHTETPVPHDAISALNHLLDPDGLKARWAGVPRIGKAPLGHTPPAKVAVCVHLFYPDLWSILRQALDNIPEPWDLWISVPVYACTPSLAAIAMEHPQVQFLPCPNRGRDVMPFLRLLEMGVFDRYDAVCKLHTKRSPHIQDGNRWLEQVLHALLGDAREVAATLQQFRSNRLGLVGPQALLIDSKHRAHQGGNRALLQRLVDQASLPKTAMESPFFAGTMFWFKPAALSGLRAINLREENFPTEMAQTDGTLAHALERLIWPLVKQAGFEVVSKEAGSSGATPAFIRPSQIN